VKILNVFEDRVGWLARNFHAAAPAALRHLEGLPVRRMPLAPLLDRMWALRENVTAYDAAYVALAEQLAATVITCDAKLAGASGTRCAFHLIS
jgi:predicted nucleic acid-binding protein